MIKVIRWITIYCLPIFYINIVHPNPTNAQAGENEPIYVGDYYRVEWSPDSRQVVFQEYPLWFTYDLETATMTECETDPLTVELSHEEMVYFAPAEMVNSRTTLFISPDERFIIYGGEYIPQASHDLTWVLMIGNRHTGNVFAGNDLIYSPSIRWSQDSTAFVLTRVNNYYFPSFLYGSSYTNDLSDLVLIRFAPPNVQDYYLMDYDKVFDLSVDGQLVLLSYTEYTSMQLQYWEEARRLTIWNPLNPQESHIIDTFDARNVIGASFSPYDENKLILVDDRGIVEYDWTTDETRILTTTIRANEFNTTYQDIALFSPDRQWAVIMLWDEYGYQQSAYIVGIEALLSE